MLLFKKNQKRTLSGPKLRINPSAFLA